MENTLENKAKFFAQYWGQPVFRQPYFSEDKGNDEVQDYCLKSNKGYLVLKPISSITDEDAIEVAKISGWNVDPSKTIVKEKLIFLTKHQYDLVDYLRSKGYALPYMGLSVEQLLEYGWIKLQAA